MSITVTADDHQPVANAGTDQSTEDCTTVHLDGSGSYVLVLDEVHVLRSGPAVDVLNAVAADLPPHATLASGKMTLRASVRASTGGRSAPPRGGCRRRLPAWSRPRRWH